MVTMLLEPQHEPDDMEPSLDWNILFRELSMPQPETARHMSMPAAVGQPGQDGQQWPSGIIRGPSQGFTIE